MIEKELLFVRAYGRTRLPVKAARSFVEWLDGSGRLDLVQTDEEGDLESVAIRDVPEILKLLQPGTAGGNMDFGGLPASDVHRFFLDILTNAEGDRVCFAQRWPSCPPL